MADAYTPIATATLTGSSTGVAFSSIPTTYTDLIIVASMRSAAASDTFNTYIKESTYGYSTSDYSYTRLYGNGSSAASNRVTSAGNWAGEEICPSGQPSDARSTHIWQINNYSNTTTFKTMLYRGNVASDLVSAQVGLWRKTDAVTQVGFYSGVAANLTGTITLYGVKSA